ncbi:MAG: hypothetical protein ABI282_06480 [Candidatus Baltobacteraceae bacterium]
MPRTHGRFSREFKLQIVESILKGAVASQVAKANDLHREVVRKRVCDFKTHKKDTLAGSDARPGAHVDLDDTWRSIDAFIRDCNQSRSTQLARKAVSDRVPVNVSSGRLEQPTQAN